MRRRGAAISAHISEEAREQLERYASAHGMKKAALVEQALLHHLQVLRELPADIVIPPRLELTATSFAEIAQRIVRPSRPTRAMKALMRRKSAGKPGGEPDRAGNQSSPSG
jgi:hypothetical protein